MYVHVHVHVHVYVYVYVYRYMYKYICNTLQITHRTYKFGTSNTTFEFRLILRFRVLYQR